MAARLRSRPPTWRARGYLLSGPCPLTCPDWETHIFLGHQGTEASPPYSSNKPEGGTVIFSVLLFYMSWYILAVLEAWLLQSYFSRGVWVRQNYAQLCKRVISIHKYWHTDIITLLHGDYIVWWLTDLQQCCHNWPSVHVTTSTTCFKVQNSNIFPLIIFTCFMWVPKQTIISLKALTR